MVETSKSSIPEHLRKAAHEAAQNASSRIADLNRQILEIEGQMRTLKNEHIKARSALRRAANFPVKLGGHYFCPLCWVNSAKMSPLRPIPNGAKDDIFQCRLCRYEEVFPNEHILLSCTPAEVAD